MFNALAIALALVILFEGVGAWALNQLKIQNNGFSAPYGAAVIFSALELAYFPAMLKHLPFYYVKIVTMAVLAICIVLWCLAGKKTWRRIFKPDMLIVLASAILYTFIFQNYGSFMDLSKINDLLMMRSNADAAMIELGGERLQGYSLFGSIMIWMFPKNIELPVYALGVFAQMIAAMLTLNIVRSFQLKNPWLRFTLIVFAIFYNNFYSWKIIGSFKGENWQVIFTAMMIYVAWSWLQEKNEQIKYFMMFVMGAGMFSSSGFLMISIEILYGLVVFLFRVRKIRSLFDLTTFLIPIVIYLSGWLWFLSRGFAWLLLLGYTFFCFYRYKRSVYHRMIWLENTLIEYSWQIFYVGIPIAFLIGTFILRFYFPSLGIPYSYYRMFFQRNPVRVYLFLSHSFLDSVMAVIRWLGLVVFLIHAETIEERMIKYLFLCMVVFFINPLCMGMLGRISGLEMYADAFDILFNPFTDLLLFIAIYRLCEWQVLGQWVLELCLVFATVFGHIGSYKLQSFGLYTELVEKSLSSEVIKDERL